MKSKIKTIFILLIVIIVFYYGFKLLIVEHNFSYKINNYKIDEHFYIDGNHYYDLIISKKKENYTYTIKENLHKQKRIIKDIKTYKSNNLICIVPIYKNEINTNIYCDLDNTQVSNDYLIKTKNEDFKKIKNKIKKNNIKLPSSNNTKKKYKKLTIYNKNIIEDDTYYIWNYKGIYVLNKDNNKYQKILDYDLYDNIMSCVVDRYYVLFENTNVSGIENIYYYDSIKNKLNVFKLKEKIAKDSYINGVADNLIYVTDRKNKKEYTINIKKKKIQEVDQDQTSYIKYEKGKKKNLSKSDFLIKDQYFNNEFIKDKKVTNNEELIYSDKNYYYREDNKIYRSLNINKSKSTLLFELDDIKEWKVIKDEIIVLVDDTIYSYRDDTGLRKILRSNELKYNYKNIYNVG